MMDADEFLTLAGKIVGFGRAGARSAVSRAYYGAFHLAITLLEDLGCAPPRNANSHKLVPEFLGCSSHPDARRAGSHLANLHARRIRADYRLSDPSVETLDFAKVSVETADRIRSQLESFRTVCDDVAVVEELRAGVQALRNLRMI